jgi:NAD(P)-dependent dehydrogenase (short-subunit alcohol dehydrogenase family)
VSKTLLNAITRHLAYELSGTRISVNAACPGWVRTDMGGKSAPGSVENGAETPVWLASEAPYNLTGKFFRDKHEIEW